MKLSLLVAWAALLLGSGAALPATADSVADQLRATRVELRTTASGDFGGPGWERLLREGGQAQVFAVGEQHGVADILAFAGALHANLARRGYTHAAMEVGPYSTEKVERLIRSGPGRLEAYVRGPGGAGVFPFLGWREEVRLAEQYVAASPAKTALWGLDQEYVGAGPILVELLTARQRTPAQRAAVARLAAAAAANPNLVRDLSKYDTPALAQAFRNDERALRIIEDFRLSGEIYGPFTVPGSNRYQANLTRENYMKRNFAAAFARAEREQGRPPKVFMKVGANHAMRGFSASTVPSLGNFLAEWAAARDVGVVTLMVDCLAEGSDAPCRPYFGADHAIYAAASADKYTLLDLRPLRAQLRTLPGLDVKTRDLIQAFDFYVLIRDVKRATPVRTAAGSDQ